MMQARFDLRQHAPAPREADAFIPSATASGYSALSPALSTELKSA